ncbi:anchored repeat-type ABC transporter ATP-binding subunit [Glycomyces harbinensis]|uniref:Manganese/iron transport system ATP-binding protein n=1 Tax=Glycomyces harbinensis TaxID=58114 RepID=A0A1G7AN08_9ACTN|nr:anchored repeat-type ABC transporter ATP-binding subunit [Glycomyces harbinensis]SDE16258.1 manganese/iron transport system ATP-binding protein [Glycomyces harbinensis]
MRADDTRTDGLRIDGLSVSLGGRPVLDGVDLAVATGETVGLIGPNGAGKTTLLRAVLGLIRPDAGTVATGPGRPGYVPQKHEFTWDFPITVHGAILNARTSTRRLDRFTARRAGRASKPGRGGGPADREAAAEALERVGLTDLAGRPVGELSGGQRQRVLVARALARRPRLLLLDEPFTGVDVPTQELLTGLLTRLAEEGTAILMTTHDLAQARATCTRICLLNRTVVADGAPEDLTDPDLWLRAFGVAASGELKALLAGTEST